MQVRHAREFGDFIHAIRSLCTFIDFLQGDASKAQAKLGWKPRVDFKQLVKMMVAHDLDLARQEKTLKGAGYGVSLRGAAAS
jgi:GDPmannose 4,6-dehydratase